MDDKQKNINKDSVNKDNKKTNNDDKKNKRRKIIIAVVIIDLLVGFICLMLYLFRDCIFGPKEPEVVEPTKDTEEDTNKENKLYNNLVKLANIKLIDANSLSEGNYINNLSSLEYDIDKVTYCAYTNDIDGVKYFISIEIEGTFPTIDTFVSEISTIDINNISSYTVTEQYYDVVSDTTTLDKFKNNASILLDKYDSAKKIKNINYKAVNPNYSYISTTYIDSDGNIRSINEIEYDISSDKFEITSDTYTFNKEGNATLLDLYNKILA